MLCKYCKAPSPVGEDYCCGSCSLLAAWVEEGTLPCTQMSEVPPKFAHYRFIEGQFNISKCPMYKEFRLYIDGLQCSSCVHLLEELPHFQNNVLYAQIDFNRHIFEVRCSPLASLGEICAAVEELGYTVTPMKESSDFEKARTAEKRDDLKRIGVAGAVAGNAMLFSVPVYAGLDGMLALAFNWILFFLFLPVLFYVAQPFYKNAWHSLLVRRVSVDLMIVAALWAGFSLSTFSLVTGGGELYFDSTAGFIFLILLTRYALRKQQEKIGSKNTVDDMFATEAYEMIGASGAYSVAYTDIPTGQLINLKRGQVLPCDGRIVSEQADFDLSFLTGEAYPQIRHKDNEVLAGSRLLTAEAQIKTASGPLDSKLAQSLLGLGNNRLKDSAQTIGDVVSHRLTLVVFSIAAAFFLLTFRSLGIESFKRALALITIACPCAVAFGTPLAQGLGLRKAGRRGYFIRSAGVFERIGKIKKIIFDKTGTLTSSHLKLVKTFPTEIPAEERSIILGLEKNSVHPLALSLKKIWSDSETRNILQVSEISGEGVEGRHNAHLYALKKAPGQIDESVMQLNFSIDGKASAYLYFKETVAPEAPQAVADCNRAGLDVMMLTGDRRVRAIGVAKELGIRPGFVFSEQSALDKLQMVQKLNPCLFAGDGLNDMQALNAAYVSFAIKGPFESTLQVSDVYAPQKNLNSIPELLVLAQEVNRTVRANLAFALLYNFAGGALALGGYINPLLAAVLMPLSSFCITAHTAWRLR